MTTKIADRVKESITTTGTGRILSLGGAENGFQSFSDAGFRDGDTFSYVIEDGSNYEYGEAIYGWNMTQAAYSEKSLDVASAVGNGSGYHFAFGNNGTKLYALTTTLDQVCQFSLSTAYDISTASYDSVSLNLTGLGDPRLIMFKPDGTKCFILTYIGVINKMLEYDLSTAWDLSSASAGDIFHLNTHPRPYEERQVFALSNLHFSSDGMTLLGNMSNILYQWDLAVAYDLSTAKGYTVTSDYSYPLLTPDNFTYVTDVELASADSYYGGFTEDGKNFIYTNGSRNGVSPSYNDRQCGQLKLIKQSKISHLQPCGQISKFYLGSLTPTSITSNSGYFSLVLANNGAYAYDVFSSVIYQSDTGLTYGANKITRFPTKSSNSNDPIDLSGNAKIFVSVTSGELRQSKIGVTANYSRRFYTRSSLQIGTGDTFILARDNTLNRVFGVETETGSTSYPSTPQRDFPTTVNIISRGTNDYYARRMDDLENSSYTQSFTLASSLEKGLWMNYDGTEMYTIYNGTAVYQYSLSTAFNLTTASYTASYTPDVASAGTTTLTGLCFRTDGSQLFLIGANGYLYRRELSTNWDITSAATAGSSVYLNSATEINSPQFNNNGTYFYAMRNYTYSSWSNIYYYNYLVRWPLTSPWDISNLSASTMEFGPNLFLGTSNTIRSMHMASDESGFFAYANNGDTLRKHINTTLDIPITTNEWATVTITDVVTPTGVGDAYGMFVPEKNYNYIFLNNGSTIFRKWCGYKEATVTSNIYPASGILTAPDGFSLDYGSPDRSARSSATVYDEREGRYVNYNYIEVALR